MSVMEQPIPEPIEGGSVPQVLVEYVGLNNANAVWRGPASGVDYHFSLRPAESCRWIHTADADHFRGLVDDFVVREDQRIDPVADAARAVQNTLSQVREQVAELQRNPQAQVKKPRSPGKSGRPRLSDEELLADLHLKDHCEWTHEDIAKDRGLTGPHPAGRMSARLIRARKRLSSPAAENCPMCQAAPCAPPPERSTTKPRM